MDGKARSFSAGQPDAVSLSGSPSNLDRAAVTHPYLKVCCLCGAPNLVVARDCVVCGWHGHFETDVRSVRRAIQDSRLGSLDCPEEPGDAPSADGREPWWERLVLWVRRVLADVRAAFVDVEKDNNSGTAP